MKTNQHRDFPSELLKATLKERVDYFKGRIIDHSALSVAFDQTMAALGSSSGPRVVTVAGPTGVGKTTLARRIYRQIVKNYEAEVFDNPSMVPVLGINAVPPNGTNFNWKDFYFRLRPGRSCARDCRVRGFSAITPGIRCHRLARFGGTWIAICVLHVRWLRSQLRPISLERDNGI
jgi:hypothetical protein